MRRRRAFGQHQTSAFPSKWKRASFIRSEVPTWPHSDTVLLLCIIAFVVLLCALLLIRSRRRTPKVLPNVPWVGRDTRQWFSKLRARTWTTVHYEAALKEAYDMYSKQGQSCILSGLDGDTVVLPPSAIPWLINLPDSMISTDESTKNVLQTKYSFSEPRIMDRTIHFDIIKGELTRQVFNMTDAVNDELKTAVDKIFGSDTEQWKLIELFDSMTKVVAKINNRVFVGLPLCRNDQYLHNAIGFAEDIALSATLLRLLPPWLRAFLGPIITIPNKLNARGFTRMIKPEILHRQRLLGSNAEKDGSGNEYLSWLLAHSPPGFQSTMKTLIGRMLHLNFASIHTTSFIGTNAIFDLLSSAILSQSKPTYIQQLLDEASSLGALNRRAVQKMHLMDACLRESSRLASIIGLGVNVKVVAEDGITAPDGTDCPKGSLLGVPSWAIHNDRELYPDPLVFRPERYLAPQTQSQINLTSDAGQEEKSTEQAQADKNRRYLDRANLSFTTTSPTYLGFGHGRHACPGRFFAAQELKLLLAYMFMKYDMELEDKAEDGGRVRNMWMGPNHVPPLKARVRVRRKVKAVS